MVGNRIDCRQIKSIVDASQTSLFDNFYTSHHHFTSLKAMSIPFSSVSARHSTYSQRATPEIPNTKPFIFHEKKRKTRAEIRARYKTELCRQFTEQGFCPFGDVCVIILLPFSYVPHSVANLHMVLKN